MTKLTTKLILFCSFALNFYCCDNQLMVLQNPEHILNIHNFYNISTNPKQVTTLISLGTNSENITLNTLSHKLAPVLVYNLRLSNFSFGTSITFKLTKHIILPENIEDLETVFQKMYRTPFWNAKTETIILLENESSYQVISQYFAVTWKYYLLDVTVVSLSQNVNYYYDPITTGCRQLNVTSTSPPSFQYFSQCPLRVLPIKYAPFTITNDGFGYELIIIQEVAKYLRMDFILQSWVTDYGNKLPNGSYTKAYAMVYENKSDISVGGIPVGIDERMLEDFDHTMIYSDITGSIYAPKAELVATWKRILVFPLSLWLLILGSWFVTSIVWRWSSHHHCNNKYLFLFEMWACFFNNSQRHPRNDVERWIFWIWMMFALIITNSFQGFLVSALFSPDTEHQLVLQDVLRSDIDIGGHVLIRNIFKNEPNPFLRRAYEKWITCSLSAVDCWDRFKEKKNFLIAKNDRSMYYDMAQDPEKKAIRRGNTAGKFIAMYVVRGFYALERIDEAIISMLATGLINKWDQYGKPPRAYKDNTSGTHILSLEYLLLVFLLLGVGLCISMVAFICENVVFRRRCDQGRIIH